MRGRTIMNAIIIRREVNPKARVKGGETMNFETVFERKQKQSKEELFLAEIEAYDAEQTPRMKSKGYTFKC